MTFHVPNQYRIRSGRMASSDAIGNSGAFFVPNRFRRECPLSVIASDGGEGSLPGELGDAWEHVSVSYHDRCPTWAEMCLVKLLFWDEEDTVMQLHPPRSTHVNNHQFCLHMWRPTQLVIPLPPQWMVGYPELGTIV